MGEYTCDALIVATGASAKYLGLPSEEAFAGKAFPLVPPATVSSTKPRCCQQLAAAIRQLKRHSTLPISPKPLPDPPPQRVSVPKKYDRQTDETRGRGQNHPQAGKQPARSTGDQGVNGALLKNNDGSEQQIAVSGIFIAIGHKPDADIFKGQLEMDETGA